MVDRIRKMMQPYLRLIRMMVGRAVINLVNDSLKMQELQLTLLADEVRADVERFQEYGFTSHPHPGAEAVMVCVGGSRDHGLVIAVDDRRYRLKPLVQGEVALYDDQGQAIHLKREKAIHVYGCDTVLVDAAAAHQVNSPNINLGGDGGTLRALIDERFIAIYNNHSHGPDGKPVQQITLADVATTVVKAK